MRKAVLYYIIILTAISSIYAKWELSSGWKLEDYHKYSHLYYNGSKAAIVFNLSKIISAMNDNQNSILISEDNAVSWNKVTTNFELINGLTINKTNIWLATNQGVYFTENNGDSWVQKNNGLSDLSITAIEQYEDKIYIASKGKFFVSNDNGENWTVKSTGIPTDLGINIIKVNQLTSEIYMGSDSGLYYSSDFGESWQELGVSNLSITKISLFGDNIYINEYLPLSADWLWESTDKGNNWNKVQNSHGVSSFFRDENIFIEGLNFYGSMISRDNGNNWERNPISVNDEFAEYLTDSLHSTFIYNIDKMGDKLIAASNAGIFVSSDNGYTWESTYQRENFGNAYSIYEKNNILYSSNYYFLPLRNCPIGNLYMSYDEGENWIKINKEPLIYRIRSIAVAGDTIYAGTAGYGLFFSVNKGKTWGKVQIVKDSEPRAKNINNIFTIYIENDNIVLGTYGGIYKSIDKGLTWTNWTMYGVNSSVYTFTKHNGSYYFGVTLAQGHSILKADCIDCELTDLSKNFNVTMGTSGYVASIISRDNYIYSIINSNGFFLSSDNGEYWMYKSKLPNPLSLEYSQDYIFVGSERYGIFLSSDNGETWSANRGNKNEGLPPFYETGSKYQITDLLVYNDYLYATLSVNDGEYTQEAGIYKIRIEDITDVKSEEENLTENPIFPNPASDFITIDVKNLEPMSEIVVHDLFGKKVLTIETIHELPLQIDVSGLLPGLYFLKLNNQPPVKFIKL